MLERGCNMRALLLLALVVGCSDDPVIRRVSGSGFFTPEILRFGIRTVGTSHRVETVLRNSSTDQLLVQSVRFEPATDLYQARTANGASLAGTSLGPGQRADVVVFYSPVAEGTHLTTMVVVFQDFEVEVPIEAEAQRVAAARPGLNPSRVDFLSVEVGREAIQRIQVRNDGDTDGRLENITNILAPFSVRAVGGGTLPLPSGLLSPGQNMELEVAFTPRNAANAQGLLRFVFDTGEAAELTITGSAVDAGRLSCNDSPVDFGQAPRGQVVTRTIDCQATGGPYSLAVVRLAAGSSPAFRLGPVPTSLDGDGRLSFDVRFESQGLAARHEAILEIVAAHQAVTAIGLMAETIAPLPGTSDLVANLVWNTPYTDFDLHLVRASGAPYQQGEDCYFEDKSPDWGEQGSERDDPFLDRDDVDGFGPEELSLTEASGRYELYVHFYGRAPNQPPSTTVGVTVQVQSSAPRNLEQVFERCGDMWHVGSFIFDASPRFAPAGTMNSEFAGQARCP